ncbi:MAG: DUF4296 domain-containing protein [Cyclonatronaceae bacterium]
MPHKTFFLLLSAFALPLFFLAGCSSDAPEDLIEEPKYIDLLVEMHILAAVMEMEGDEELFRNGQDAVLSHHDISRDQFLRSHDYYHRDMRAQQRRFNKVRDILDELGTELSDRYLEVRDTSVVAPYVP